MCRKCWISKFAHNKYIFNKHYGKYYTGKLWKTISKINTAFCTGKNYTLNTMILVHIQLPLIVIIMMRPYHYVLYVNPYAE